MREKRRKVWIDRLQTQQSIRLALYFILYQAAVVSLYWVNMRLGMIDGTVGEWTSAYGFMVTLGSALGLGVLFITDAMKHSHRIVGPLYRFRKTIEAITAGENVPLVKLRDGDYLLDMRDEFNAMLRELERRGAIRLTTPQSAWQLSSGRGKTTAAAT